MEVISESGSLEQEGNHHTETTTADGPPNSITVAVRIRPFSAQESAQADAVPVLQAIDGHHVQLWVRPLPGYAKQMRTFAFDHVFTSVSTESPAYASQARVFERVGAPVIANAFEGFDGCLLAYGQTGSGKSYSVLGSEVERGVLPRACEELFEQIARRRLEAEEQGLWLQATVYVSYLEIHQEKLYDLLSGTHAELNVRIHPVLGPHVPSLAASPVTSMNQVQELLEFGSKNRVVAATLMNAQSSRSHAVFTIELRLSLMGRRELQSKIHFVDLAGSEKQKKTDATGERLSEGIAINQSLTTLSRCILALSATASTPSGRRRSSLLTQAPFRESKLTLLLKDALSGNSRTCLIACVSPSEVNLEESVGTLDFASRCKLIKVNAKKNEPNKADYLDSLAAEKRIVEAQLQRLCAQQRALQEQLDGHVQESKQNEDLARATEREKRDMEFRVRLLREFERKEPSDRATPSRRAEQRRRTADAVLQNPVLQGAWGQDEQLTGLGERTQDQELRRHEPRYEEWQRLQQEQEEMQSELQRVGEERARAQEQAEKSCSELEERLRSLTSDEEQAQAQLAELSRLQSNQQEQWEALLMEQQLRSETLQRACEARAEQTSQERAEALECLQREKEEELQRAELLRSQALSQLQARLVEMQGVEQAARRTVVDAEQDLQLRMELEERRHLARTEELQRELVELEALRESWMAQRQDLESNVQEQVEGPPQIFKELGILGMDSEAIDSRRTPHLVNLHQDAVLGRCLVYYLQRGETRFGSDPETCEVPLAALGVRGEVCTLANVDDVRLTVRPVRDDLVRVNGALVGIAGCELRDGDRLAIGRLHLFRAVVPDVRRRRPSVCAEALLHLDHELGCCADLGPRWQRRIEAAVLMVKVEYGIKEARGLLQRACAAAAAIEEADRLIQVAAAASDATPAELPSHDLLVQLEADYPPRLCVALRLPAALGCSLDAEGEGGEHPCKACSSGLWEASRFAGERLPKLRQTVEVALAAAAASRMEAESRRAAERSEIGVVKAAEGPRVTSWTAVEAGTPRAVAREEGDSQRTAQLEQADRSRAAEGREGEIRAVEAEGREVDRRAAHHLDGEVVRAVGLPRGAEGNGGAEGAEEPDAESWWAAWEDVGWFCCSTNRRARRRSTWCCATGRPGRGEVTACGGALGARLRSRPWTLPRSTPTGRPSTLRKTRRSRLSSNRQAEQQTMEKASPCSSEPPEHSEGPAAR